MSHTPGESRALSTQRMARIGLAIVMVAVSARFDVPVPGSLVPQSGQTLAVLIVGLGLGARDGAAALLAYLLCGALGLPVFADGASGWGHLVGPTAGYLVAFVFAAGLIGWLAEHGRIRRFVPALVAMIAGHVLILGLGWLRLGAAIGYGEAYGQGVAPFLVGGAVKSLLAAAAAVVVARRDRAASDRAAA